MNECMDGWRKFLIIWNVCATKHWIWQRENVGSDSLGYSVSADSSCGEELHVWSIVQLNVRGLASFTVVMWFGTVLEKLFHKTFAQNGVGQNIISDY